LGCSPGGDERSGQIARADSFDNDNWLSSWRLYKILRMAKSETTRARLLLFLAQAAVLVGFPLLSYFPGFHSQFHLDDWPIVRNNRYLNITDLKPATLYRAAFQDFKNNRPLVNLTLALNYYLVGRESGTNAEVGPFGFHLLNFLVLVLTAFGIWLWLRKLPGLLGFDSRRGRWAAFAAALVWGCHPVNVQAITYVVQRYASMAGMFSVWSIYFFHLASERGRRPMIYPALSACFCLSALLSKESAATLPALLFLYKLFFFDRLAPGWLKKNWAWLLGLVIFYGLAAIFIFRPSMAEVVFNFSRQPFGARERFFSESLALLWYPFLIIFPFPQFLSLLHQFPVCRSFFQPEALFPLLAVCAAVFLAIVRARSNPVLSFAIIWYLGQLLVEALPLPIEIAHEHRLYLAQLSIIVPLVAFPILKFNHFKAALSWSMLVALFFGFFTWQRNKVFISEQSLWRDTLRKAPEFSSLPWRMYCLARVNRSECSKAIPVCRKAEMESPEDLTTINNLGACYLKTGELSKAQVEFLLADSLDPGNAAIAFNLGLVGSLCKDYAGAIEWYLKSIAGNPRNVVAHYYLALAYKESGREQDYLDELEQTLKLAPDHKDALAEMAIALAKKGRCQEVLKLAEKNYGSDHRWLQALQLCKGKMP